MSQLNVTTLKHESAGVNNITLDANGRVGIGTNNPTYNLTVAGNGTSGLCAMAFVDESNSNKEWRIDQSDGALRFTESGVAERMRIDSAGRVTMPYQPSFTGRRLSSQAAGIWTHDVVDANIGGCWNGTRFTCPIAGRYLVITRHMNSANFDIRLNKNGVQAYQLGYEQGLSNWAGSFGSVIITCTVNDYLEIYSSTGTYGDTSSYNHVSIHLLS